MPLFGAPLSRRGLLGLLACTAAALPVVARGLAGAPSALYLSCCADRAGRFHIGGFDADGRLAFELPLPGRGHSFAVSPSGGLAVHFARRPGTFALVFDCRRGAELLTIASPEGRHFYGHGIFTADGGLLYAPENDYLEGRGVVGLYDAGDGFRRIGELPSHGVGPHDVKLLADGVTLVVANGGILTRPDLPRVKLNIPEMAPSLVYLDRRDGRLLGKVELARDLHQLSIRHLALRADGLVAFVMQYEGPKGDLVPLVGTHRPGEPEARLFDGPEGALRAMDQYCGSAAFDASGRFLAASSPRGGVVQVWDADRATLRYQGTVPDGCGVAAGPRPGLFLASSGRGGAFAIDAEAARCLSIDSPALRALQWDNHLVPVPALDA